MAKGLSADFIKETLEDQSAGFVSRPLVEKLIKEFRNELYEEAGKFHQYKEVRLMIMSFGDRLSKLWFEISISTQKEGE